VQYIIIPRKYISEKNISCRFVINQYKSLLDLEGKKTVRLSDIAEEITDGTRVKRKYLDSGVRIISPSDFKNGNIYPYNIKFISREGLQEKDYVKEGDILMTAVGKSGQAAMVSGDLEGSVISSDIIRIRMRKKEEAEKLLEFLNSESGQYALESVKSGVLNRITVEAVKDLIVPVDYKEVHTKRGRLLNLQKKADELYRNCLRLFEKEVKQDDILFELPKCVHLEQRMLSERRLDPKHYVYYKSKLYEYIHADTPNVKWQKLNEVMTIKKAARPKMLDDTWVEYINLSNVDDDLSVIKESQKGVYGELSSRIRYVLQEGEIITAKAGSATGTEKHVTAVVTQRFANMMASDAFYNIVPKGIDPYYLLFLFKQPIIIKQLDRASAGLYFRTVNKREFENIRIPRLKCEQEIAGKMREYVSILEEYFQINKEEAVSKS